MVHNLSDKIFKIFVLAIFLCIYNAHCRFDVAGLYGPLALNNKSNYSTDPLGCVTAPPPPACETTKVIETLPYTIGDGPYTCYVIGSDLLGKKGYIQVATDKLTHDIVIDCDITFTNDIYLTGNNGNTPNGHTVFFVNTSGHQGSIANIIANDINPASVAYYRLDISVEIKNNVTLASSTGTGPIVCHDNHIAVHNATISGGIFLRSDGGENYNNVICVDGASQINSILVHSQGAPSTTFTSNNIVTVGGASVISSGIKVDTGAGGINTNTVSIDSASIVHGGITMACNTYSAANTQNSIIIDGQSQVNGDLALSNLQASSISVTQGVLHGNIAIGANATSPGEGNTITTTNATLGNVDIGTNPTSPSNGNTITAISSIFGDITISGVSKNAVTATDSTLGVVTINGTDTVIDNTINCTGSTLSSLAINASSSASTMSENTVTLTTSTLLGDVTLSGGSVVSGNNIYSKGSKLHNLIINRQLSTDTSSGANGISISEGSDVAGNISVTNLNNPSIVLDNATVEGSILGGNLGNAITMSNNATVSGGITVGGGSNVIALENSSTISGSITASGGNNIIDMKSSAAVFGNIITSDGDDTLTMTNSALFGCYDLGGGHNTVTIDNSFARQCPQTYTVPFVEWGCCKDDNIGNTIFYGDGTSIYACLGGKTLAYPVTVAPDQYYNQAFYWMNHEGDKPRKAAIAIALDKQEDTQKKSTVSFFEYEPSHDGSLGAFSDAGSFVPQADFPKRPLQVYGVAWHVGLAGQDWDPSQQYLAVSFLSEIPAAPGSTDYVTINYIDIYRIDTSSLPYKFDYIAGWNATPEDHLSHPVSYLTWQPATGFGSNPLVLLGVSPLDGAVIAVPIIGLPTSSAKSFTANKTRQAITVSASDALPKNPVIFATPTYLYAAGLFADASGNLQQQLTRYTVEVAEASPAPIVTFTQDKSFIIDIPVATYGYVYKIRSCNGATSDPLFMSFLVPQNKQYFVNIDVDSHAITPYDTTLLSGFAGLDFVPRCPGYTAAGLLGTTGGNQVWQFSCTRPAACSVTKVWPVAVPS